uniref:Complex I-B17 n=1 Tax=Elaeophora elaphi TaxID=1147741 RepID=A0A0R3S6L2_9BILA
MAKFMLTTCIHKMLPQKMSKKLKFTMRKCANGQNRFTTRCTRHVLRDTMKKMVNDMFGERGAFWQHLYGPFWEVVNAYGTDSNLMNPILIPLQQRKYQKEVALQLPEIPPYPDPPSFCNYEME